MSNLFHVNQVRDVYIVSEYVAAPGANNAALLAAGTGAISLVTTESGDFTFLYKGVDGTIQSTDLIPASVLIGQSNVLWARATAAADYATKLRTWTITLDPAVNSGNPVAGQEYILNINLYGWGGLSRENAYFKFATVYAYTDMTAAQFYTALADSIERNFRREPEQIFTVNATATEVVITEVAPTWTREFSSEDPIDAVIYAGTITTNGDDFTWGIVEVAPDAGTIPTGQKIADLEYFGLGERGDVYRNNGWPYVISHTYIADPNAEYGVIDLDYYYVGNDHAVQKSEKTLTLASTDVATLNSIIGAINTAVGKDILEEIS